MSKTFEVKKGWINMWLWGLVGKDIAVDELIAKEIGDGNRVQNVKIDTQMSFLNGLVDFVTLGIYSPQSIKITGDYQPGSSK